MRASLPIKQVSQVHLPAAEANGLGFECGASEGKEREEEEEGGEEEVAAVFSTGFELGLAVMQHAHFSLTSALDTRHVSHVHLDDDWAIFLKRVVVSGAAAAAAVVAAGLGPGFAVEQQTHLSDVSSLGIRHVSQVHFEV